MEPVGFCLYVNACSQNLTPPFVREYKIARTSRQCMQDAFQQRTPREAAPKGSSTCFLASYGNGDHPHSAR